MAKKFSWSFSKAKNFDACAKRHYEVDLAKNFVDSTEQLVWGNQVHDALKEAVVTKTALPDEMREWQKWATECSTGHFTGPEPWLRHLAHPDRVTLVEQKIAITKQFQPCGWSDWNNAWYRGICDVAVLDPTRTVGLARDWKTGKVQHDSRQLMLMAQVLFAHNPTLMRLKTEFVWLKEDCVTPETFDRATIAREWPPVLALVKDMENAAATMNYPPKPGRLCARYCPVISCPYHGKRHS